MQAPPRVEVPTSVLVFSRTAGFRHDSIDAASEFFRTLDAKEGFDCTLSEDASLFTDEGLAAFDVVVFSNTTGDVLSAHGEQALERFVRSGKGFVGVHAAADTEHDWPFYRELVGALFVNHPETPLEVELRVDDGLHPATAYLPATFRFTDEWYNFDRNPRTSSGILLTLDESGFTVPNTPPGPSMGADHPVAWYHEIDKGRVFYTNLGHRKETWQDPLFRRHLLEGLRYAAAGSVFSRSVLTRDLANPMAIAVTPARDVYIIERTGEVWRYSSVTGELVEVLRLAVDTAHENGLLGVALDPAFPERRHIYLYYSEPVREPVPEQGPPGRNVLVRFDVREDGSIAAETGRELLAVPSERFCCHEGGALAFGRDGTLFISTGDNTNPFDANGAAPLDARPGRERHDGRRTAANPFDLRGKILRVRADGSIPDGNLFPKDSSLGRPEIFVMGVRNPYRIATDPSSDRLFFGDIGPDAGEDSARGPRGYDEINVASTPGDYGWPLCIGENQPYAAFDYATGATGPFFDCGAKRPALLAYDYTTPSIPALGTGVLPDGAFVGRAAMAGAVYRAATDVPFALPARFSGALFMMDWTRDRLATVHVDESDRLRSVDSFLASQTFRRPTDIELGPDGALYILEYGSGFWGDNPDAALSRVEYAPHAQLSPRAHLEASVHAGSPPLRVTFSALGSSAPRRESIVDYRFFVDGAVVADVSGPLLERVFEERGVHRVALVVSASSGVQSQPVSETIVVGNAPPTVTILAPDSVTRATPGVPVTLVGQATDPEDGDAPCEELTWNVSLGHNAHAHPVATLYGCTASFLPELGEHAGTPGYLFYAVELTYTDRGGVGGEPPLTARRGIQIEVQAR